MITMIQWGAGIWAILLLIDINSTLSDIKYEAVISRLTLESIQRRINNKF
jgi:hypothetical protein